MIFIGIGMLWAQISAGITGNMVDRIYLFVSLWLYRGEILITV